MLAAGRVLGWDIIVLEVRRLDFEAAFATNELARSLSARPGWYIFTKIRARAGAPTEPDRGRVARGPAAPPRGVQKSGLSATGIGAFFAGLRQSYPLAFSAQVISGHCPIGTNGGQ
jgi:hypothetical protein